MSGHFRDELWGLAAHPAKVGSRNPNDGNQSLRLLLCEILCGGDGRELTSALHDGFS